MLYYKKIKFESIELMCHEANAPDTYVDVIRPVGAPNKTVTNNADVFTELNFILLALCS